MDYLFYLRPIFLIVGILGIGWLALLSVSFASTKFKKKWEKAIAMCIIIVLQSAVAIPGYTAFLMKLEGNELSMDSYFMYLKVIGLAVGLLTLGFGTLALVNFVLNVFEKTWLKVLISIFVILVALLAVGPAFTAFVYHL